MTRERDFGRGRRRCDEKERQGEIWVRKENKGSKGAEMKMVGNSAVGSREEGKGREGRRREGIGGSDHGKGLSGMGLGFKK